MTCAAVRAALPALLHEDVPAEVRQHLDQCPACAAEFAELQRLRDSLDALPPPPAVTVDLARVYHDAARLQARRLRIWKRVVAGVIAAAALLLVTLLALRLEVSVAGHQLVIRWGEPPAVRPPEPSPPVAAGPSAASPEELALLRDLIHALESDVRARDLKQEQALAQLRARLDAVQGQSDRRWADSQQSQRALYTALFGSRDPKGDKP